MSDFLIVLLTSMFFASFILLKSLPVWLLAAAISGFSVYLKQPGLGFAALVLIVAAMFFFRMIGDGAQQAATTSAVPLVLGTVPPLGLMFLLTWVVWFLFLSSS